MMGVINKKKTAIACGAQIGGIVATMKLAPKGKRWPFITAILVGGEIASYVSSRRLVKKQLEEQGYEFVKYSMLDHYKTLSNDELPNECWELHSEE